MFKKTFFFFLSERWFSLSASKSALILKCSLFMETAHRSLTMQSQKKKKEHFLLEVLFFLSWILKPFISSKVLYELSHRYFSSMCSFCDNICYSSLSHNYFFTYLFFVSQILSIIVPGQVGGLTALNILHTVLVYSTGLKQVLALFLLQWNFRTVP